MSRAKVKEELKNLRERTQDILHQKELIHQLEKNLGLQIKSPRAKEIQVQGGEKRDQGEILDCILEAKQKLCEKEQEHIRMIKDHTQCIISMAENHPEEASVLYNRYFLGHRWESIAEQANYSEAQVFRIHGKALGLYAKAREEKDDSR